MPVPTDIDDLSTNPALNDPPGSDAVFPGLDDHLRFQYACIALLRDRFDTKADLTSLANTASASAGAGLVGFDPDLNYAVSTIGWAQRLRLYPEQFGAVGDNSADDTTPLQNTLAAALLLKAVVDGRGKTYKVTAQLSLHAGLVMENITLDASTGGNSLELLAATGSMGASTSVTSGSTAGSLTVNVSSTAGLAVDDYVYLGASDMWDDWDDLVTCGEVHRIKSIGVGTVTFFEPVLYTVSTTVTLAKINTVDGITLRRVKAIGSKAGAAGDQEGARFAYCKDLTLEDCDFQGFDDRCVRLTRCINTNVRGGVYGRANKTGLSYGIALGKGCYYTHIVGAHFVDCRHGVTHGDNEGVNRYTTISGCTFAGMREAGVDTHTAADYTVISGNTFDCDPNSSVSDGVLIRSVNVTIADNQITNPGRYGIYCLGHTTLAAAAGALVIRGNTIEGVRGVFGVYVRNIKSPGAHTQIVVEGNSISSAAGIASSIGVYTQNDLGTVRSVVVCGNIIRNFRRGIYTFCAAGTEMQGSSLSNNVLYMAASATEGIYVNAGTDGNNKNIVITGNSLLGTTNIGVRGVNEENLVIIGNNLIAATTKTSITATNNVNANNLT